MITISRNVLNNTGVWINPRVHTATPPMVNDRPTLPIDLGTCPAISFWPAK